ncbi:hypothetical protein K2173_006185 [Erythroxylum novogranatense]|uniref:DUF4283 domain-containing protein n=1 Tax=Erythroxylum novogranatense TaxID=1862640 RepID=A0AAV8TEK1_9ROSI|nr:hypothetical protein K2173_006185 [Erythroxylum novogranatense]
MVTWVCFIEFPMEFYRDKFVAASAIKTLIKVDRQTSMATKGRCAKVCVELDLEQPLVPKVFIGGAWRRVEYEGILGVYSGYGRVKHCIENCMEVVVPVTTRVEDSMVVKVDKGSVGPGKRISSVSGPVDPRDKGKKLVVVKEVRRSGSEKGQLRTGPVVNRPVSEDQMVLNRRKEALEVGQSSGSNIDSMVFDVSDQNLVVES